MSKGKRGVVAEELDLVPIMNLVTILIPFLLMAAQFVSYAVIDSTLPVIGPPQ
jgi:biopolymer transport protein ExbD